MARKILKAKGYEYNGYKLGQVIEYGTDKAQIVAFDTKAKLDKSYIAIVPYTRTPNCIAHNIENTNVDSVIAYCVCNEDYFCWVKSKDIKVIEDKKVPQKCLFEVGQNVWEIKYGWGTVEALDFNKDEYSVVQVRFVRNNLVVSYSVNGIYNAEQNRTLFFEELQIPESALIPPKWRAEYGEIYFFINSVGEVCYVRDNACDIDINRYKIGNYFETEEKAKQSNIYKGYQKELNHD